MQPTPGTKRLVLIEITTPDYIEVSTLFHYVGRALKLFVEFDPQKAFEKGHSPRATILNYVHSIEDIDAMYGYLKVHHRLTGEGHGGERLDAWRG